MSAEELRQMLPSSLLSDVFKARVRVTMPDDIDWKNVISSMDDAIGEPILKALKALSKLDLSNIVESLLSILPQANSPEFPSQALGLLYLIDQGPRALLEGVDERWQVSVFDPLAIAFARKLHALPTKLRPYSKDRWLGEQGWDMPHWLLVQLWFTAVFVHSESKDDHKVAVELQEEMRLAIEQETGTTDPFRAGMEEDLKHPDLFFKRLMAGQPQGEVNMQERMYPFLNILWVHEPIINVFGRYPYRNSAAGRASTPAEEKFLEETSHFGEVEAEAAAKIKEDIDAGRWTPIVGIELP